MTLKRFILVLLTAFVLAKTLLSLGGSFDEPQVQARLDLYQADLILQATEAEVSAPQAPLLNALLGAEPYVAVSERYDRAREEAVSLEAKLQTRLEELPAAATIADAKGDETSNVAPNAASLRGQLVALRKDLDAFVAEIDLKQGWLQLEQGDRAAAFMAWEQASATGIAPFAGAAAVSLELWQETPQALPEAQATIESAFRGWFRDRSLSRLYEVSAQPDARALLATQAAVAADAAIGKLAAIGAIPTVAGLIGVGLLLFLLVQWALSRDRALLAQNGDLRWETPWDVEITWQVLVVGFFAVSQLILPVLLGLIGLNPSDWNIRGKAFFVFASYLAMAVGGLAVLWVSIQPYLPLPKDWFSLRGNWLGWGFGGYFVAVPLVILVSLVNQQIWQGQGGSNPLLYLAVQAQDWVALGFFFLTAAVLAPLFEEIVFRGFLLPALTKHFPVWGAIALSALIFSLAHLSLSEVLPLAVLGGVLGFVYTRSRSLLASILLHGLWNGGTLASLFVLGSGVN
ncbi:MAG: lysostaphin resistance A-like protein [Cyanobacteria bacterium J06641_5]